MDIRIFLCFTLLLFLMLQCPTFLTGVIKVRWDLILPQCEVKLTVASKISDGQSPSELQLMVMRWYPGQDPLEDTAFSSLKQLLHGLIYTTEGRQVTVQCKTICH